MRKNTDQKTPNGSVLIWEDDGLQKAVLWYILHSEDDVIFRETEVWNQKP